MWLTVGDVVVGAQLLEEVVEHRQFRQLDQALLRTSLDSRPDRTFGETLFREFRAMWACAVVDHVVPYCKQQPRPDCWFQSDVKRPVSLRKTGMSAVQNECDGVGSWYKTGD
jgi:hypothetical protein